MKTQEEGKCGEKCHQMQKPTPPNKSQHKGRNLLMLSYENLVMKLFVLTSFILWKKIFSICRCC